MCCLVASSTTTPACVGSRVLSLDRGHPRQFRSLLTSMSLNHTCLSLACRDRPVVLCVQEMSCIAQALLCLPEWALACLCPFLALPVPTPVWWCLLAWPKWAQLYPCNRLRLCTPACCVSCGSAGLSCLWCMLLRLSVFPSEFNPFLPLTDPIAVLLSGGGASACSRICSRSQKCFPARRTFVRGLAMHSRPAS